MTKGHHYINTHFGHFKPSWWQLKTVARAVLCLLAVCWHGVHSAHECGLTLLQRTEEGAGDHSARLCVLCSPVLPPMLGQRPAQAPTPWFTAWVVSSKASYPQWICFLCRKQIKRGEFKDTQVQLNQGREGEVGSSCSWLLRWWQLTSWASLTFSLEQRGSQAVERFHSNKQILCFWMGRRREDGRLAFSCLPVSAWRMFLYEMNFSKSVVPRTCSGVDISLLHLFSA